MNENVKQAYLDKTTAQLQEWTAKVDVVKARIAKDTADVRIAYHTKIENWQTKESVFKSKLAALQAAGDESFEALKSGAQSIWNEMGQIIKSLEGKKNE